MKVVCEKTLAVFREAGRCELCGRPCNRCYPHHVLCRGMGGGARLDVPLNLVAVCEDCHGAIHAGGISQKKVIEAVAYRERTPEELILPALHAMVRITKEGKEPHDG